MCLIRHYIPVCVLKNWTLSQQTSYFADTIMFWVQIPHWASILFFFVFFYWNSVSHPPSEKTNMQYWFACFFVVVNWLLPVLLVYNIFIYNAILPFFVFLKKTISKKNYVTSPKNLAPFLMNQPIFPLLCYTLNFWYGFFKKELYFHIIRSEISFF